jgi:hypothetical protein
MEKINLDPVVKIVTVLCSQPQAFDAFTRNLQSWWPLDAYSVGLENAESCQMECHQGGDIFEITKSGDKHIWGTIQNWLPPGELTFSWHPGRTPETAQIVTVSFHEQDDGTRVTLAHGGWETLGDAAAATRERYIKGWDCVIGQFFVDECSKITVD